MNLKIPKLNWFFVLMILLVVLMSACSQNASKTRNEPNKNEKAASTGVVEVSYDELIKVVSKEEAVFVMLAHKRDLQNTNAKQVLDHDAKQKGAKVYLFSWEDAPKDLTWNSNEPSKTRDELENIGITEPKSRYAAFKNTKIIDGSDTIFSKKKTPFEEGEFIFSIEKTLGK
ncbi:hypothetical protein FOL75_04950 [Bacillus thuringiensis]|uniref:hypothetical protein n=1 Tax=Bacillus thuringiensis TaxID=1428 RepID=UPI002853AFA3|nr:hypothetical protein [Bacillus thuringiensis]MDR5021417.1 hypothetical protein [Bacillus thuringiensis]